MIFLAGSVFPSEHEIDNLTTPLTPGEREVYELFRHTLVPEGWDLYVQPHLNGLRPDFVLLHPQNGIAVFEVKDFSFQPIKYSSARDAHGNALVTGTYSAGTFTWRGVRNPFEKIRLYRTQIANLYCARLGTASGPQRITAGLIFPNARYDEIKSAFGPDPYEYFGLEEHWRQQYPVVGGDYLREATIASVFPLKDSPIKHLEPRMLDDLRNWLSEPELFAEQRRPLEDEIRSDLRQHAIVTDDHPPQYRRIRGAAGSGKSLMIAARAAELAIRGNNVLVVNFGITLLNYLRDHAARYRRVDQRAPITFHNFHAWCKWVCCETGHAQEYQKLWDDRGEIKERLEEVAELTASILNSNDLRLATTYDAILVDEGQDCTPEWWNILRLIL